MPLVGFFEEIASERGLEWRFADSLSLRQCLGCSLTQRVPDHATLRRTRQRLPLDVHQAVVALILGIVERKGLLKGRVPGVDSTSRRADASRQALGRRDTKESYLEFVTRLATEAGVPTPTAEDARRLDRTRTGKKTSNRAWGSRTDHDARMATLKDGRTRLADKPEHVVDLETGASVAAAVHGADVADPASLDRSLGQAEATLQTARGGDPKAAQQEAPAPTENDNTPPGGRQPRRKVVADTGDHKATLLRRVKVQRVRTYLPERRQAGRRRWTDKGGTPTAVAFHQNRARGVRPLGKRYHRWRSERGERTFAHVCETGGARRTRLRGRANVAKRSLLQAAGADSRPGDADRVRAGHPAGVGSARPGDVRGPSWLRVCPAALVACPSSVAARVLAPEGGVGAAGRRPGDLAGRTAGCGINQRAVRDAWFCQLKVLRSAGQFATQREFVQWIESIKFS
jgi:transposase